MADELYEVTERLGITEDGRAVPEGSTESRWFYAAPGTLLPMEESRRVGLVASEDMTDEEAEAAVSLTEEVETVAAEVSEDTTDEPASAEEAAASGVTIPPEIKRSRRFRKST